jgi:glycosyltransferase involved in cell wall biosynthesis
MIDDGIDGATVPADDPTALARALTGILESPDRAFAMGRAGRAKVERDFTPDVHLDRIRSVYAGIRP